MKSAVDFRNPSNSRTNNPLTFVKIPAILSIFAIFLISLPSTISGPTSDMANVEFSNSLETFGVKLFSELAKENPKKNIVFSPFSIQTCVAMARMGAAGETAAEMDKGFGYTATSEDALADNYHSILATYEDSKILKIANKIYIMKNYEIQEKFNELLTKKFFSTAENINFAESQKSAQAINGWVESKTNNLIKDLVSPDSLNQDTRLVLLNAIHFKGDWVHPFPEHGTREKDFYLDETNTVKVQMMHISENFRYGEFPELDATALEMPYKDSDLSMLVILPNSRTGLAALEEKLKTISLQELTSKMYSTKVIVDMPKFKAEFEVELKDVLKNLGMGNMFSDNADFSKMLKSPEPLKVSKVIHKAFIEVNEKGTEAAAATGMSVRKKRSLVDMSEPKDFICDHPYVYYINHKTIATSVSSSPSSTPDISLNLTKMVTLFMGSKRFAIGDVAADNAAQTPDSSTNRLSDELYLSSFLNSIDWPEKTIILDHGFYYAIQAKGANVLFQGQHIAVQSLVIPLEPPKEFNADHGYIYAIRNKDGIPIMMVGYCMPMFVEEPKVFEVDRPFVYMIKNYDELAVFKGTQMAKVKFSKLFILLVSILIVTPATIQESATNLSDESFAKSSENFGVKIFSKLGNSRTPKNVIFSPFSIQACLAMVRMGAAGETAGEMDKVLGFSGVNEVLLADKYHAVLSSYSNSNILKIANKIYIMKKYQVQEKYNDLLGKKFFSDAENIDFADNINAAKNINSWVESKTNNLIKNLISPNILSRETRLVLVNAIHFKGEWVNRFPESGTKEKYFHLDGQRRVKVKMMHVRARFRYGEIPQLDAKALEMRYKDSDLSMLVLLPNSRAGLNKLEEKLKTLSLHELTKEMYNTQVIVDLPKFKSEFNIELSDVLKKLGMGRIFTGQADFSKILKTQNGQLPERLAVSKVIYKAYIDVNEKGTEAAAATGTTMVRVTSAKAVVEPPPKIFNADHPFHYFVRNSKGLTMFEGSQILFK
ncbi:uncharacterized protein LOC142240026 [Haematobia irritans]|uniref:uncharacterized protein LOC142240026 n=1 Tax=Haematobia irritans TaxID=7368 RepID=UPI003F502719